MDNRGIYQHCYRHAHTYFFRHDQAGEGNRHNHKEQGGEASLSILKKKKSGGILCALPHDIKAFKSALPEYRGV